VALREVGPDDLPSGVPRREVDCRVAPALERMIGDGQHDGLRVEVLLALEVGVEAPARQPRARHHLVDRYGLEAVAVEERLGAPDYLLPHLRAVATRIGHAPRVANFGAEVEPGSSKHVLEHISSRWFRPRGKGKEPCPRNWSGTSG